MTDVAQIHRLSTGVAAAEDSAAALDDACSCRSSSNPAAILRNKSNSIATGVVSGAAAVLVVEVLDSLEFDATSPTAIGALVGTSAGCDCSSLDWLVVVASSGGNVGETKVAAGVVAGAPSIGQPCQRFLIQKIQARKFGNSLLSRFALEPGGGTSVAPS